MNERVKELRKSLDMTQNDFANRLGVKRNTVGQWECGINPVTEQTIVSICREFNVNENWLRNGEGEMFKKFTRDEEIAKFVGGVQSVEGDSFKKRLIAMLSKLNESEWLMLEKMALELTEKKD